MLMVGFPEHFLDGNSLIILSGDPRAVFSVLNFICKILSYVGIFFNQLRSYFPFVLGFQGRYKFVPLFMMNIFIVILLILDPVPHLRS